MRVLINYNNKWYDPDTCIWNNGTKTNTNEIVYPSIPTDYSVTVQKNGCSTSAEITFGGGSDTIEVTPDFEIINNWSCISDKTIILNTSQGDTSDIKWYWYGIDPS